MLAARLPGNSTSTTPGPVNRGLPYAHVALPKAGSLAPGDAIEPWLRAGVKGAARSWPTVANYGHVRCRRYILISPAKIVEGHVRELLEAGHDLRHGTVHAARQVTDQPGEA